MTVTSESYHPGGFDPDHPTGNVAERTVDNGDGTGTRTAYDADGNVTATEALTGLQVADPVPLPDDPDLTSGDPFALDHLRSPRP